jgi:hypothetical protein
MPGYNRRIGACPPARSDQRRRRLSCLLGRRLGRNFRALPSLTTILGFVSLQPFEPEQTDQRSPKTPGTCSGSTAATGALTGFRSDDIDRPPQPGTHSPVAFTNGARVEASDWYRRAGSSECAERTGGDVFNGDRAMPGFLRPLRHERHASRESRRGCMRAARGRRCDLVRSAGLPN